MNKFIENLDLSAPGAWIHWSVGAVFLLLMLFMPKRLSWREILCIFAFVGYIAWMINMIVASQMDLFDLGDPIKVGLGELLAFGTTPSALSVIFLNYYKQDKKWMYVILFTTISFVYLWGATQLGNIKFHGFRLWQSIPAFLIMYGFVVPWFFKLLRKEFETEEITQKPKHFMFFLNFLSRRKRAR